MFIETESGSTYQVILEKKLLRRVCGALPPTDRQGEDETWQTYFDLHGPFMRRPMIIVWRVDKHGGRPIFRSTITSWVTSITETEKVPN